MLFSVPLPRCSALPQVLFTVLTAPVEGLPLLGVAEGFPLPRAVQCSSTQSGRQDASKQNMMAGNVME
ncbi:hypothetical protein EK904_001004, partial [Melospiza melodia maxima]